MFTRDQFYAAFTNVTGLGHHIPRELDVLFRRTRPTREQASIFRSRLYQAIRYNDWKQAWIGALDGVVDPDRAFVPLWFRNVLTTQYGNSVSNVIAAWLQDAPTFLRVNTLRTTVAECVHALAPFRPRVVNEQCIQVDVPYGLFRTKAFTQGWFELQDVHSQRVGPTLISELGRVHDYKLIIDLCAGAGGKTLHMAAMLRNQKRIVAFDVSETRLTELKKRAQRAQAFNIEVRHIEGTKSIKRLNGKADAVLVDAPCTGTGVLRRNPDILYHLTDEQYRNMMHTQSRLLHQAYDLCKPGGFVAYSTCSILASEGSHQIESFISNVTITESVRWSTAIGEDNGDGFFMWVGRKPTTS